MRQANALAVYAHQLTKLSTDRERLDARLGMKGLMSMTQQEKAQEVLDSIFIQARYARVGVSENFLRGYAVRKWVGENERLKADTLIVEADARVVSGHLIRFRRNQMPEHWYKLP